MAPGESMAPSSGAMDFSGKTITVGGAFVDVEAQRFADTVKPFEDATGATVVYSGDKSFEQNLNVQVQAGNPPDVALLPQPGGMKNYASQGKLFPLPDDILANIDANYGPGWKESGTADDGKVYGVFHRVNPKAPRVLPEGHLGHQGLHRAHDVGRDDHPDGQDRGRRHAAVVHRHRERRGHGLAVHRLGRGGHAPDRRHGRLRQVGRGRHAVHGPRSSRPPSRGSSTSG